MTDLAADMRRLGRLTKRLVTPEAKELRYQIMKPFRRALAGIIDEVGIDSLVRHIPGEGLQLDPACTAEVMVAMGADARAEPANETGSDPEPTRRTA